MLFSKIVKNGSSQQVTNTVLLSGKSEEGKE